MLIITVSKKYESISRDKSADQVGAVSASSRFCAAELSPELANLTP